MKPTTVTLLAAAGALTIATVAVLPLAGPTLGGAAGVALAGAGMIACGMVLRRERRVAEIAPAAPTSRCFPAAHPPGAVIPFGRKGEGRCEAQLTRDLVRRAERICAAARVRRDDDR